MASSNIPEGYIGLAKLARDGTPPDFAKSLALYLKMFTCAFLFFTLISSLTEFLLI